MRATRPGAPSTILLAAAAALLLLVALSATAGAEEGQGPTAGEAPAAHGASHDGAAGGGGPGSADHWSVFSEIVPASAVENIKTMVGLSWLGGEPVGRVMHVPGALFAALISLGFGIVAGRRFRDVDEAIRPAAHFGITGFMEVLLEGVWGIATQVMDPKWARQCFPLLATLTVFILVNNLMAAIPGLFPPTDNLNTTLAMAIVVFFATHYFGVKANGLGYFKHFLGPIHHPAALPLMILMVVIETIGHLARPVSLSIRLMGNMTADHAVLAIFLGFTIILAPLPIQVLGLIVACVQAMVFLLLSAVYIGLAVAHDEDH